MPRKAARARRAVTGSSGWILSCLGDVTRAAGDSKCDVSLDGALTLIYSVIIGGGPGGGASPRIARRSLAFEGREVFEAFDGSDRFDSHTRFGSGT